MFWQIRRRLLRGTTKETLDNPWLAPPESWQFVNSSLVGKWQAVEIDLKSGIEDISTGGADHLLVTVFSGETPLGRLLIRSPFDPMTSQLLEPHLWRFSLKARIAELREAFYPPSVFLLPKATLIICTRDRLDHLHRCLEAVKAMDLELEVIVVDNSSGDPLVRKVVVDAGARYVHEPVPGLDRARNRGILEANSSVVLFTDDDVEVRPTWARHMLTPFSDPNTVAVTGLVLPASVSTPVAADFERHASFVRGWEGRVFDGTRVRATKAGNAGAGASLAFRRDYLLSIGGFAEELDAGRPTGSGGDTYVLYRALRDGWRLRYEPKAVSYHTHRESAMELQEAVRGYGRGVAAYMAKATFDDGDRAAAAGLLRWGGRRVVRALVGSAIGSRNAGLFRAEATGISEGIPSLVRARRQLGEQPPLLTPRGDWKPVPSARPVVEVGNPEKTVAVVIPSRNRRESLLALVAAVLDQDYPADLLKVIVSLDGDTSGSASALRARFGESVTLVEEEQGGPGLARNRGAACSRGDILIFFDDDTTPDDRGVVAAHVRALQSGIDVGIGPIATKVSGTDLFSRMVRNWWNDHSQRIRTLDNVTFTDVCTGNLSIRSELFKRVGGFAGLFRREDWELGYRLILDGARIGVAEGAEVLHFTDSTLGKAVRDRRLEGIGDVAMVDRSPEAYALLPLGRWHTLGPRQMRAASAAIARPRASERWAEKLPSTVGALESFGLVDRASALVSIAFQTAYWSGVGEGSGSEAAWLALASTGRRRTVYDFESPLELTDGARFQLPTPPIGEVVVTYQGEPVGTVPLRWGGNPWDRQRFGDEVIRKLAPLTFAAETRRGNSL